MNYLARRTCPTSPARTRDERAARWEVGGITTVLVVRLGKPGACTAACFARKALDVAGFDASRVVVATICERGTEDPE